MIYKSIIKLHHMKYIKIKIAENTYANLAAWAAGAVAAAFLLFAILTTSVKWMQLPDSETVRANEQVCEAITSDCDRLYPERYPSDLIVCDLREARRRGVECHDLSDVTWGAILNDKFGSGNLFVGSIILGFMGAVAACIVKFLATQPHAGWQRLSIVSGVVGSAMSYYILEDDYRHDELFIYWYWCTAGFFLAPVGLKIVYTWVRSGFGAPAEGSTQKANEYQSLSAQPIEESKPLVIERAEERVKEVQEVTWAPASFWSRFFARCLDVVIVFVLTNLVTMFIPDIPSASNFFVAITMINLLIAAGVLCAVYYWYEVFFLTKYGATPGKMALGLRVENRNHEPLLSSQDAKARTLKFLGSGLYYMLFFPIFQIVSTISALRRRGMIQPWDGVCGSTVLQKPINPIRSLLFKLLGLFLVFALVITVQAVKQIEKQQLRNAVHQNYLR